MRLLDWLIDGMLLSAEQRQSGIGAALYTPGGALAQAIAGAIIVVLFVAGVIVGGAPWPMLLVVVALELVFIRIAVRARRGDFFPPERD